jgi:hypothetical protein
MNVWIWGPPMWDLLHASAFLADANGIDLDPLVQPLTQILPCSYCRDSFNLFYGALGAPKVSLGATWVYEAHKLVTQKLMEQRLKAFLGKYAKDWPSAAVETLKANGHSLVSEPTLEVVQKRFMVNRDEPFQWRTITTVLVAFVMGLEVLTGPMESQYEALVAFLKALCAIVKVSHQCTSDDIIVALQSFADKVSRGPAKMPPADLRVHVEDLKYSAICRRNKKDAKDYSRLIKAGACINGSCQ